MPSANAQQSDRGVLTVSVGDEEDEEEERFKGVKELKKTYNKHVKAHEKELKPKKPLRK